MQIKIKPKIGLFLLTLLFLSAISLTAEALEVKLCRPNCTSPTGVVTFSESAAAVAASGVNTTTLNIAIAAGSANSTTLGGFTVAGTGGQQPRAQAIQSATLQQIKFITTMIKAPTAAGSCTTNTPCPIEIVATSAPNDFPIRMRTGGYPSSAYLAGSFTGTQAAAGTGNGDTISMTAEASGLSETGTPLSSDVINATPGGGAGDVSVSLPGSCTGSPTCKFTATSALGGKAFNSQLPGGGETVQHTCDLGLSDCKTRQKVTLNVSFKTPGNSVSLPLQSTGVNQEEVVAQGLSPQNVLLNNTNATFDMEAKLWVFAGIKSYAAEGRFMLDIPKTSNGIFPHIEEVYFRVADVMIMIPPGKCKRLLNGMAFFCLAKVEGLDVAASFTRGKNPAGPWNFVAAVHGVNLVTGHLPAAPEQVPVELIVGIDKPDSGMDLVTATIFP